MGWDEYCAAVRVPFAVPELLVGAVGYDLLRWVGGSAC